MQLRPVSHPLSLVALRRYARIRPPRPELVKQFSKLRPGCHITIHYQPDCVFGTCRVAVFHREVQPLNNGIDERVIILYRTLEQTKNLKLI
jgi:hypothetical protein